MCLDGARGAGRARDVGARVDATEVDARLVVRATGVPQAHGRGRRAAVRARAHGPVVERQARLAGGARAAAVARAPALAAARAPQVRGAVAVRPALAVRRRARQLAGLGHGQPVLARAPGPVRAHRARPGRVAPQAVARVPARAVRRARQRRRAVGVPVAPGRLVARALGAPDAPAAAAAAATPRVGHAPGDDGVAYVTVGARALRPVRHRPA